MTGSGSAAAVRAAMVSSVTLMSVAPAGRGPVRVRLLLLVPNVKQLGPQRAASASCQRDASRAITSTTCADAASQDGRARSMFSAATLGAPLQRAPHPQRARQPNSPHPRSGGHRAQHLAAEQKCGCSVSGTPARILRNHAHPGRPAARLLFGWLYRDGLSLAPSGAARHGESWGP